MKSIKLPLVFSLFMLLFICAGAPLSYKAELFPAMFDGNTFSMCENLPGQLQLIMESKTGHSGKSARFFIELPDFVKLTAISESWPVAGKGKVGRESCKLENKGGKLRDGIRYTVYEAELPPEFTKWLNASWYRHNIFLRPEAGSSGKSAKVYWHLDIGGEKMPEHSFLLKMLPPVKKKQPPCKYFYSGITSIQSAYIPALEKESTSLMNYWKSLADNVVMWRYTSLRERRAEYPGFQKIISVDGGFFYTHIVNDELHEMRKHFPVDIKADGTPNGVNPSVWSLLEDKDRRFENYLRNCLRKIKKEFPEVKIINWDFEPHPYGYDEGGRARFARKTGLKSTPSVEEIRKKYSGQWFDYMVKLHAEYIAKVAKIVKEELPEHKFALCSDNLHAEAPHVASWCGVDVSLSDSCVDLHMHMPYYTGLRYYDDVAYNTKRLKKPYFPLTDPAERLKSFYTQYTPAKVIQNIVATAANGGMGITFYPDDTLKGEYLHSIAEGFDKVAVGEKYYFKGVRCDKKFTLTPQNVVTYKLPGGKSISMPDFSRTIRYTAHQLDGKYLFTVFNYDEKRNLIVEISGGGIKPFLMEISPNGCEIAGTGLIPPQEKLRKKIKKSFGKEDIFKECLLGKKFARWNADRKGNPVFQLSDGIITVGVDLLNSCEVNSFITGNNGELFTGGFAGRVMFADTLQPKLEFRYAGHGIDKSGVPFVRAEAQVAPYEGANPEPNPLYGMKIKRLIEVKNGRLFITHSFKNPAGKPMPLKCRLSNYPWAGERFMAESVALASAGEIPYTGEVWRYKPEWRGGEVTLTASDEFLKECVRFVPDAKFNGIYSWALRTPARKTVEFVVDTSLEAGKTLTYTYIVDEKR